MHELILTAATYSSFQVLCNECPLSFIRCYINDKYACEGAGIAHIHWQMRSKCLRVYELAITYLLQM